MPTFLGRHRLISSRQRQSGDARQGCRYPTCSLHSDLQAFARSLWGQARSRQDGSRPERHSYKCAPAANAATSKLACSFVGAILKIKLGLLRAGAPAGIEIKSLQTGRLP